VVLVGGFVEPSFVWDAVGPLLARHHRVYVLDLDGFGYTQRRGPWTLQEWADQTQSFMEQLDLRRPVVVGHSLGAAVAVALAQRRLTSRIVLLDGDALKVGGPPGWLRSVLVHSPFFTTAFRLVGHMGWLVRRLLANAYGPYHPRFDTSRWTDQLRAAGARQAFRGMLQHGLEGFTRPELRRLRTRAVVVWGADDSVDGRAAGAQTARDLRARFVVVPDAGHLSMLAQPAGVARAIERG
jgi:pimeloyl-ACP methyl ester carboxylesterase